MPALMCLQGGGSNQGVYVWWHVSHALRRFLEEGGAYQEMGYLENFAGICGCACALQAFPTCMPVYHDKHGIPPPGLLLPHISILLYTPQRSTAAKRWLGEKGEASWNRHTLRRGIQDTILNLLPYPNPNMADQQKEVPATWPCAFCIGPHIGLNLWGVILPTQAERGTVWQLWKRYYAILGVLFILGHGDGYTIKRRYPLFSPLEEYYISHVRRRYGEKSEAGGGQLCKILSRSRTFSGEKLL